MKTSIMATTALAGVWLGVSALTAFAGPLGIASIAPDHSHRFCE